MNNIDEESNLLGREADYQALFLQLALFCAQPRRKLFESTEEVDTRVG